MWHYFALLTLLLYWQQQNMCLYWFHVLLTRFGSSLYCIDFEAVIFVFYNQENLIQCTEPDSVQVSTKDMDSTLSKASRAIKKTSKKVKADRSICVFSKPAALEGASATMSRRMMGDRILAFYFVFSEANLTEVSLNVIFYCQQWVNRAAECSILIRTQR